MRGSIVHSLFGSQATVLRLLTPSLNHLRHPGEGRDPDPERMTPRSVDGCWFGLGPGLRRDDETILVDRAEVRPIGVTISAVPVRVASATSFQRQETRLYFSRQGDSVAFDPQRRRNAPLQAGDSARRTCRLCRPRALGSTPLRASIAARGPRAYLRFMKRLPCAKLLRTP